MVADLSTSARQALITLMVRAEKVSNPDLRKSYRTEIKKDARAELEAEKLITCEVGPRRAIFHELTDKGWVRARQEFRAVPPANLSAAWLLHYATLRQLASLFERSDLQIADAYAQPDRDPEGVAERIVKAYFATAGKAGDLVRLAAVRDRLADVDRAEQDRVLLRMDQQRDIHLDPDPRRNELSPEEIDAALVVGGEAKHLIAIDRA